MFAVENPRRLRRKVFSQNWALDEEIREVAAGYPTHQFLVNPAALYTSVYLTRYVKAFSEEHFGCSFSEISVLDWGCGKGHISKLISDLGPKQLASCDILSDRADSSFGQDAPIIDRFGIQVTPLQHEYILPYDSESVHVLLSVGVLEHVSNERASLAEISRVLKPRGVFFCFFLPARLSWTQQISRWRGDNYHDRLYTKKRVRRMLQSTGMEVLDIWYRQMLPKNSVRYPNFRLFERMDQYLTERTLLRYFATNLEFVSTRVGEIR
jgi:2-polyprenyl-3-methyl-5-hydroxy-6-metoxy-1,4-benzoquinol methylase